MKVNKVLGVTLFLIPVTVIASESAFAEDIKNETLQSIADEIFSEYQPTLMSLPTEEEDMAMIGTQYLYCAVASDILNEKENAENFYLKGMNFLDGYAAKHAYSNPKKYETLEDRTIVSSRVGTFFHHYWFINNKDVLKGMLFAHLANRIEQKYVDIGEGHKESKATLMKIKTQYCKNL